MSVEEFTYLRGRTKKPVKVTLVSAQQAAAYYDPDKSRAAYPTRDAYLADLVDFTRREIAELLRLGCEYSPDRRAAIRGAARRERSAKATVSAAAIPTGCSMPASSSTTRSSTGHPGVTFGIHICRGNHKSMFYASGGYDRIAEQVFSRASFDRFLLEYDDERSGTFEPLRYVPDDRVVVLGLVSSKTPRMETAEEPAGADRGGRAHRPARAARPQPAVRLRLHARRQPALAGRSAAEAGAGGIGCARDLELNASRLFVQHASFVAFDISRVLDPEPARAPSPSPRVPTSNGT